MADQHPSSNYPTNRNNNDNSNRVENDSSDDEDDFHYNDNNNNNSIMSVELQDMSDDNMTKQSKLIDNMPIAQKNDDEQEDEEHLSSPHVESPPPIMQSPNHSPADRTIVLSKDNMMEQQPLDEDDDDDGNQSAYKSTTNNDRNVDYAENNSMTPEQEAQKQKQKKKLYSLKSLTDPQNWNVKYFGRLGKHVMRMVWLFVLNTIFAYYHYFLFNMREIRKRKLGYLLGLLACLVVVLAVAIASSALSQLPIIFLRLAENNNGEYDIRLVPKDFSSSTTLNMTAIEESVQRGAGTPEFYSKFQYFSPRLNYGSKLTTVFAASKCFENGTKNVLPLEPASTFRQWAYLGYPNTTDCSQWNSTFCASHYCDRGYQAPLFVIDTLREKKMQLGRNWRHPPMGASEAYLSPNLANSLNVTEGDSIVIQIDGSTSMVGPYRDAGIIKSRLPSIPYLIYFPVTVKISDSQRKISIYTKDSIFMEYDQFLRSIAPYVHPDLPDEQRELLSNNSMYPYAQLIYYSMRPSRIDHYNKQKYDDIKTMVIQFASQVLYYVGFDQVGRSYPMLEYMNQTQFFSLFLGLIVNIIIVIMALLSIMLIYSLLMINVENRAFEMGVMRMIGMKRLGLLQLIFMQSLFFAIPGVIIGLAIAQLVWLGVAYGLSGVFSVKLARTLNGYAVLEAALLGLFLPIIASILPIRNALTKNLHDSLDTNQSKTKSVKYSIERNSEGKISLPIVALGAVGAILGFFTYYFFPLALLSLNLTLLLYMFFAVLIAMLLGLTMLTLNVETIIEKFITFVCFFWENGAVQSMITKNLTAHRERNRKTTIMLSLSLGFIIFISIAFNLQVQTFTFGVQQSFGTRLNLIFSENRSSDKSLLKRIEKVAEADPVIKGRYTYMSQPLNSFYDGFRIQSLGRYQSGVCTLYAVPPNFLNVVRRRFLRLSEQHEGNIRSYNVVKQLYSRIGTYSMLIGSYYKTLFDLKKGVNDQFALESKTSIPNSFAKYTYRMMRPLAFMDSAPTLSVSKFPGQNNQDALVSFPTYLRMMNRTDYVTANDIPLRVMFLEIDDNAKPSLISAAKKKIKDLISSKDYISLKDMEDDLSPISIAIEAINYFFLLTAAVAMFICFFSLISGQYTNIQEQTKEIAVLRAIGCRRFLIVRLFIYEAFVLVLSASLMGICIGFITGYTMSAQSFLFTQLPLQPVVPWQIMILVIGLSFVFAIISALFPTIAMLRLPIVVLLKRII